MIIKPHKDNFTISGVYIPDPDVKNVALKGIVVKSKPIFYQRPSELAFRKGMPWKTEMEIGVGDEVLFSFHAHRRKFRDLIYLDYWQVFARLNPLRPVNGYLFVRLDEEDLTELCGVRLDPTFEVKKGYGTVVAAGKAVEQYALSGVGEVDIEWDDPDIKVGDRVFFKKDGCAVRTEWDTHQTLGENNPLYAIHRKDILLYGDGF